MFGWTKLLTALSALADSLNALAGTAAEINGGLRGRLTLDGTSAEAVVLTHQPPQVGTEGAGTAGRSRRSRKGQGAA